MYSGYVNVTDRDYLFYWFAEAEDGAGDDAPLIVWSNGGPGCSAMEGMTTEHGPLLLLGAKEGSGAFAGRLSRNPYSWNRRAHVLYVDQPRYVGYSCGTGPFVTSSVDAGKDMVTFLRGWRQLFPEHAHRGLVLATESYGGHYIPAWSSAIMDYNEGGAADKLTITGILIGNGIINDKVQRYSFVEFAKRQGLIPADYAADNYTSPREMVKRHLGYQPNYYDYRLREKECCGCSSYDYKPWADWLLREDVARALNVCGDAGNKAFGNCAAGCISLPEFDKADMFDYSGELGRALSKGVKVTLYYGMQDTACDYVGGYAVAAGLDWPFAQDWADSPFRDLVIGGGSAGKVKAGGGLTWVQVSGAGHMVPINSPAAASFALGTLLPKPSSSSVEVPFQCPVSESRVLADEEAGLPHPRQLFTHRGLGGLGATAPAPSLLAALALGCLGAAAAVLALGRGARGFAAAQCGASVPLRRLDEPLQEQHEPSAHLAE
ncbi:unnamed protein product [Prorocentrum cordatum]|nr:unnamed protein product [Polarella glacialis]